MVAGSGWPDPPEVPAEEMRAARRRTFLTALAAGGAVTVGAASLATVALTSQYGLVPTAAHWLSGGPRRSATHIERVYSRARGRTVDLVMTFPEGRPSDGLPVCALLHGLHGNARGARSFGIAAHLSNEAAARRITPFALVAVDGGDNYWNQVRPGDNPMAMLLDELPGWLRERGLGAPDGRPFACAGTSMGGFGALLYARRRAERGDALPVVAALSPALMTSWRRMRTRGIFPSRQHWRSVDPVLHPAALDGVQVGLWCGTGDGFIGGVREFVRRADPEVVDLRPGGHNVGFLREVAPDVVRFIGTRVPSQRPAPDVRHAGGAGASRGS